jgi:PAS domain S-box-containing protein
MSLLAPIEGRSETATEPRVPLEAVIATSELGRRVSRPPDFAAENAALVELMEELSRSPGDILQKLIEKVQTLCRAHSAGISILEHENVPKVFRWHAVAGRWAGFLGGTMPREISPCGTVLDQDRVLLMSRPQRHFPFPPEVVPEVEEALLAPFHIAGEAVGTVWAIAHDESLRFDAEDQRLLVSLSKFASAAYQQHLSQNRKLRLAAIVESSDDAIISKDLNGVIKSWNRGAEVIFGYTAQEAIGQPVTMLIPKDRWDEEPDILDRIRRGTKIDHYETVRRRKDGALIDISLSVSPLVDGQGTVIGASKIARDVTERKRAERELRALEQRFREMIDALPAAIYTTDADGRLTHFNPAAVEMSGRVPQLGTDQWCVSWKLYNPDGTPLPHDKCPMAISLKEGRPVRGVEAVAERPDGTRVWFEPYPTPLCDAQGRVVGGINMLVDITERKRAEEALRESEERFRMVADNMAQLAWTCDKLGNATWYNRRWLDYTGLTVEQMKDWGWMQCQHPDHVDRVVASVMRSRESGELWEDTFPLRGSDGQYRWFLSRAYPIRDQNGQVVRWFGTNTDIDETKRASDRLRLLWEAAGVLLATDNPDAMLRGLFAKIAPRMGLDAFFNYMVTDSADALRLESCVGIADDDAKSINQLDFGQSICGTVAVQREPIHATHIQASDDPKVQLVKSFGFRAYACNPLMSEGRLLGTLSFASRTRDQFDADELAFFQTICQYVTAAYERLRLLRQLKEADRRKDEFLAALAHELRNPLNPIRNAVESLRIKGPPDAALQFERDVIARQVEHLTRLIDDLLDINRIARDKLELRKQPIELSDTVQAAIEMSRPLIDQAGHELTVRLPDEPVWLDGDPARLSQVLMNLLNNAVKYTEPGGQIWLTAIRENGQIAIAVTDTGIGIPPDKLANLFELFYQADQSLERSGGGLGIGLSLVRRFVEMHGGSVTAHSEGLGMGSEFTVRLPVLADAPVAAAVRSNDGNEKFVGGRRILVVDDNQDSAKMLATLLRLTGNEVETAFDGLDAIQAGERFGPDVVLMDIGMPRLNGYETCRRMRQQPWGKQALLIAQTGWGQNEDKRRTAEAGFDAHFVKPVSLDALNKLLNKWQPARV